MSSQQKLIFALALFAGCVALASSQAIDVNKCTSAGPKLVNEYAEKVRARVTEFSDNLVELGMSQFDPKKITGQINQITTELQSMVNANGFELQQTLNTFQKMVTLQTQLVLGLFNPNTGFSAGRAYMNLISALTSLNTDLLQNLTQACSPTGGSRASN